MCNYPVAQGRTGLVKLSIRSALLLWCHRIWPSSVNSLDTPVVPQWSVVVGKGMGRSTATHRIYEYVHFAWLYLKISGAFEVTLGQNVWEPCMRAKPAALLLTWRCTSQVSPVSPSFCLDSALRHVCRNLERSLFYSSQML